ncbi:MAG: hypothetical protein V3T86_08760 [Planctomycetota bacterium]
MTVPIVTVASFDNELQANLARVHLEAAGLRPTLVNQIIVTCGEAGEFIELQVHATEANHARALLPRASGRAPSHSPQARIRRASDLAVLGICLPPLTICSIWMVLSVRHQAALLGAKDRQRLRWAVAMNLIAIVAQTTILIVVL